jgi:hypothetical protein
MSAVLSVNEIGNGSVISNYLPDFDFLKVDKALSLDLSFDYEAAPAGGMTQRTDVRLGFTYRFDEHEYILGILLKNAVNVSIPTIGPNVFEFGELYIYRTDMPGRQRYAFEDHLDGMTCRCEEVTLEYLKMARDDGSVQDLWSIARGN